MDNDMPWHLKTGEYILNHHQLPVNDPFSYAQTKISDLGKFILTQYWFAQILYWGMFSFFGVKGIVFLIACIFSTIAFLLYVMIKEKNSILAVLVIGCYFTYFIYGYNTLRPQIFTFLFSALTIYSIHKFKKTSHTRYLVLLPPMFLLWANMHGGFIFGIVILCAYLASDLVSLLFPAYSADITTRTTFMRFVFASILSLGVCYFNPNHYDAFGYAFRSHATAVFSNIQEYQSPLRSNSLSFSHLLKFWLTIPLSITVVILGGIKRKFGPVLVVLFAMVMSFTAIRYFPLLVIVTTAAIGQISSRLDVVASRLKINVINIVLLVVLVTGLGVLLKKIDQNTFDYSTSPYNPAKAIQFLKMNDITGNIYGSYNKSGHLILGLYPKSKVFWSSNFISVQRFEEGQILGGRDVGKKGFAALYSLFPKDAGVKVRAPLTDGDEKTYENWLKKINNNGTEIILHEALNIFSGEPTPLVFLLLKQEEWKLIYADGEVLIFLKNIPRFQETIKTLLKPKEVIFDQLIAEGTRGWISENANFPAIAALGYLLKGDSGKFTETLIQDALENDPKNQYALVDDMIFKKMNKNKMTIKGETK
jgi:hypothetical protein